MHITHGRPTRLSTPGSRPWQSPWQLIVGIAFAMLCASHAHAQTAVSGAISTHTRWTQADSPYLVSGEVLVQGGAVLSLDPGVTVYMGQGAKLSVVAGSVQALRFRRCAGSRALRQDAAGVERDSGRLGSMGVRCRHHAAPGSSMSSSSMGAGWRSTVRLRCSTAVEIRNSLGAAISVDLAASPVGVGNKASGNTLNGIAVPAGEPAGSVRWGLRGIPYIIESGALSVGVAPKVASVSPQTVEQGQIDDADAQWRAPRWPGERFVRPAGSCSHAFLGGFGFTGVRAGSGRALLPPLVRRACASRSMRARSSSPMHSP